MVTALVLLSLAAAPKALFWVTDQGAVPLVCGGSGARAFGPTCRAQLPSAGTLTFADGAPRPWDGWGPATLNPWDGEPETVALLTPAQEGEPRRLASTGLALPSAPGAQATLGGLTVRVVERKGQRPALVDAKGRVRLTASEAATSLSIEAVVDLEGNGRLTVVVLERCVNEERLTVLDGQTLRVLFRWGYCGI